MTGYLSSVEKHFILFWEKHQALFILVLIVFPQKPVSKIVCINQYSASFILVIHK